MNEKAIYLTFPVMLLKDAKYNIVETLDAVVYYCLVDNIKRFDLSPEQAQSKMKMTFGNLGKAVQLGNEIFSQTPVNAPKTSVSKDIIFDFYNNYKSDFEIDCFLGFAALRSILQSKPFIKCTNAYLLARMAGNSNISEDLPEWVRKYQSRYHLDKLKKELQLNWGLKIYGEHVRGFYISFIMELKRLIYHAELKRKSNRLKGLAESKKEAKIEAKKLLLEHST